MSAWFCSDCLELFTFILLGHDDIEHVASVNVTDRTCSGLPSSP